MSVTEKEIREDVVRKLLARGGPLHAYLDPNGAGSSFSKFKEMVNETCGTEFSYGELYASTFAGWFFNAQLNWDDADEFHHKGIDDA